MKRLFTKLGGGKKAPEHAEGSSGVGSVTASPPQAFSQQNSEPAISRTTLPYDPAAYGWLPAAEAAQLSPEVSRSSPAPRDASRGRMRSARRPRETLEFGVMILPDPVAPQPPRPKPPIQQQPVQAPVQPPPPPPPAPTSAEAEEAGLAAVLVASQATAQEEEEARSREAEAEEDYEAEVERVMEESLATADYDALLRDIRLWIVDLNGATGDVASAREEAAAARAKLDADMAAADPDDPDGMHRLCWLSEQYPGVEARLSELSARLAPIADAVEGLKDLREYIDKERPPLPEAENVRDAVIAKLFDDLGRQGLDANHPMGAYGREGGNGGEGYGADLRDLVQALIENARRLGTMPPPPRRSEREAPAPEPVPTPAPEEPVEEMEQAEPEPEPEPEPPAVEAEATPEPEPEPEKQSEPPAISPPAAQPSTPEQSAAREPGPREIKAPKFWAPKLSERTPRRARVAVRPETEDKIQRVPTIVTLHHELGKGGVVSDAVGWHLRWAPKTLTGSPPRKAAAPGRRAGAPGALPAKDGGKGSPGGAAAALGATASDPVRGAEVAALTPASLAEVAEFVADQKARYGEDALPPSGARWAVMAEAATVYDSLVEKISVLNAWEVPSGAKVAAEARRLAEFMEEVSTEAGRVTYPHDRLRQSLAKQGVPWDPSLLVDLRWAAQHAAAVLMQAALEATNEACKQKRAWHTSTVLEPLGCAAMAVFRVHQFCGGFNKACTALWAEADERIDHWGRSIDPKWLRMTRQVNG